MKPNKQRRNRLPINRQYRLERNRLDYSVTTKQEPNNQQPLYSFRAKGGGYSKIFETIEEIDPWVREVSIPGTIGIVTFTPLLEVEVEINIPWEKGFAELKDRYREPGAGDSEPEAEDSTVRTAGNPEAPNPKGNRKQRSK